jgi:hypothetical protein
MIPVVLPCRRPNHYNYSSFDNASFFLNLIYTPQVVDDLRNSFDDPLSALVFMVPRMIPTRVYTASRDYLAEFYSS